ncbi:hypothetical protein EHS25_009709 [Saitozyma podzolica]|uniref:Uncharacterized protein n=1 Tax=Saitozyma podzolica TaxID=1890683 RepID=A0A427YK12_9TREE|nr:hypothetical protein EHS25_009709 [Saitozyma podzolica]
MGNNHSTPARPLSSLFKKKKKAPPRRQEYQELSALHPTQEAEDGGSYDSPPVVEDTNPVMTTSDTSEATIQHHPREATPEREEVVRLETLEEEEGIIWTSPPSPEAAFNSPPPAPEGSHASPAMPTSSATTPKGRDITPPSPSPRGDGAPAPGAQSPSTGTSLHTPPGPSREAPTPPTSRHTSGVRSSLFNSSSSGYAPILESGSESSFPDTRRVVPTAERDRRLAFWDPRPPFLALLGRRNSSGATVTPATATMGGHPTGDSPPNPTPSQQAQPNQPAQGHPEAVRTNPARNSLPARHRRADSQPDVRFGVDDTGRANIANQDDEDKRFRSALYPSAGRQRSRSVSRSSDSPLLGDNSPTMTPLQPSQDEEVETSASASASALPSASESASRESSPTTADLSAHAGSQDAAVEDQGQQVVSSNPVPGEQRPDNPNAIVRGYDVDSPADQDAQPSTHTTPPAPHNTGDPQRPRAGPSTNLGAEPSYPLARPTINGHSSALSPISEGDSSGADTGETSSTEPLSGLSDDASDTSAGPSATMLFDNGSRFYEHFTPTASQEAIRIAGQWAPRGPVRSVQSPGGSCPNLRVIDYNDECETDRRKSYPKLYPAVYAPNDAAMPSSVMQVNQDSQDLYEQLILSAHVDAVEEIEREWAEVCGEERLLDVRNSLTRYLENPLEEPLPPQSDLTMWVGLYMAELYEHYRQRLENDGLCFRSLDDADGALPQQNGPEAPCQSTGGHLKNSESSSSSGSTRPSKDSVTSNPDYASGRDAYSSCTSEADEQKDWVYYRPGLRRAPRQSQLDAILPVQRGPASANFHVGVVSLGAEDHGNRFRSVDHDMDQEGEDESPDASPEGSPTRRRSSSRDTFGNPRSDGANPPPSAGSRTEEFFGGSNDVGIERTHGGGAVVETEDNISRDRHQHQHESVEANPGNFTSRRRASSLPVGNGLSPQYPQSPSDGRSPTPTLLPIAAEASMFASPAVSSVGSIPSTTFQPLEALPSPMTLPSLGTILDDIGLPAQFRPSRRSDTPSEESAPSRMQVEEYGLPFVFPPWTGGGGFGGFTTYRDDIVPGPSSQPMERARHLSSEMDLVRYGAAQKEKEDVDMREEKDEHRVPVTGRIASGSKGKKRAMSKEPSDKENEKDEGDGANSA